MLSLLDPGGGGVVGVCHGVDIGQREDDEEAVAVRLPIPIPTHVRSSPDVCCWIRSVVVLVDRP